MCNQMCNQRNVEVSFTIWWAMHTETLADCSKHWFLKLQKIHRLLYSSIFRTAGDMIPGASPSHSSFISSYPTKLCWEHCSVSGSCCMGTNEDERTVLFKTISLDGIKPNTNPKTNHETNPNPNINTNPNPKLTLILTLFSCFMLFSSTVLWSSV